MMVERVFAAIMAAVILVLGGVAWHYKRAADAAHDDATRAEVQAQLCSAAAQSLETEAAERAKAAAEAVAKAEKAATDAKRRADAILATPAAAPGDDCKSAQMRAQAWLKGRGL